MPNKLYNDDYLKQLTTVLGKTFKRSIDLLNPQPKDIIADIGCGVGNLSLALAKKGASVFGIDSDEAFLNVAKANNNTTNPVNFVLSSAENINVADNFFDKIVFHRVFQHLPNYDKVLTECNRILKQQGIIHIAEPDYLSATFFSENIAFERKLIDTIAKQRIPNSYNVRTLPNELKNCGFRLLAIEVHNYIFNSLALVNYLVNFEDEVNKGSQTGHFTESDVASWQAIKALPDNCFNFSMNIILYTAQKN